MSLLRLPNFPIAQLRNMDPRRSLVAGIIWLMIALAASFAVAASIWAGRVAREIVVQQHVRRLALETEQLASDLGQAVSARLDALRAAGNSASPGESFQRLREAYPELGWIAAADINGTVLAADEDIVVGSSASREPWFSRGLQGPWIGMIEESRRAARTVRRERELQLEVEQLRRAEPDAGWDLRRCPITNALMKVQDEVELDADAFEGGFREYQRTGNKYGWCGACGHANFDGAWTHDMHVFREVAAVASARPPEGSASSETAENGADDAELDGMPF